MRFVWEQGNKHPVDQNVDDEIKMNKEEMQNFVLPDKFTIYCYDCPDHSPAQAECICVDGVWTKFEVILDQ